MSLSQTRANFQRAITNVVDNKKIFGVSAGVEKGDGSLAFIGSAGNLAVESQYFIASTTKLYITAIAMRLRQAGRLSLDDPISKYLDGQGLQNLLVFKGADYTRAITVRQLLAHTSGLPDYFQQKRPYAASSVSRGPRGRGPGALVNNQQCAAVTLRRAAKPKR